MIWSRVVIIAFAFLWVAETMLSIESIGVPRGPLSGGIVALDAFLVGIFVVAVYAQFCGR